MRSRDGASIGVERTCVKLRLLGFRCYGSKVSFDLRSREVGIPNEACLDREANRQAPMGAILDLDGPLEVEVVTVASG
jgi:hypothetical protein